MHIKSPPFFNPGNLLAPGNIINSTIMLSLGPGLGFTSSSVIEYCSIMIRTYALKIWGCAFLSLLLQGSLYDLHFSPFLKSNTIGKEIFQRRVDGWGRVVHVDCISPVLLAAASLDLPNLCHKPGCHVVELAQKSRLYIEDWCSNSRCLRAM